MKFERVKTVNATGTVLGHTHRLAKEGEASQRLSKGTQLEATHIDMLLEAGLDSVMVAVLEPDDVLENPAVERLAQLFLGMGIGIESPRQGRCNLYAVHSGVLDYDVSLIHRLNTLDWRVGLAIKHGGLIEAGTVFASIKVIPYAVPQAVIDAWESESELQSGFGLQVYPLQRQHVALIVSHYPGQSSSTQRIVDVHRNRVEVLGSQLDRVYRCEHSVASVAKALQSIVTEGWDVVLFYGASAVVDIDDTLPVAIRSVGGEVERVGMPVEPGNMLLLGQIEYCPVIGVPRCAQHIQQSGLDFVLARVLSGAPLSSFHISQMGVGGYLKSPSLPVVPITRRRKVGAVVLMAGLSSRMKAHNKLSMSIPTQDGHTTVAFQTVQRILSAGYAPVVVVTGHQEREIRALLKGLAVQFVHNPGFVGGMGTSIAKAFSVLSGWDAGVLALGDMPFVGETVLAKLYQRSEEFPEHIVVPVHKGRRGHPIIFPSELLAELQQCSDDVGARAVLENHHDIIEKVDVSEESIFWDVDTEDLLRRYVDRVGVGQS